jgi:periplasmic divalent cation tolerance protein
MDQMLLFYTTWPDAEMAERAARAVVDERLAACANILGRGVSIYRWRGAVERADETVMILKTSGGAAHRLRDRLAQLHPYDVPAIVALPVLSDLSSADFLSWVGEETGCASERRSKLATPEAK